MGILQGGKGSAILSDTVSILCKNRNRSAKSDESNWLVGVIKIAVWKAAGSLYFNTDLVAWKVGIECNRNYLTRKTKILEKRNALSKKSIYKRQIFYIPFSETCYCCTVPASIYLFKVNNGNTRTIFEICYIKLHEDNRCCSGFFIVNFKHISQGVLVFLSFTLSR